MREETGGSVREGLTYVSHSAIDLYASLMYFLLYLQYGDNYLLLKKKKYLCKLLWEVRLQKPSVSGEGRYSQHSGQ